MKPRDIAVDFEFVNFIHDFVNDKTTHTEFLRYVHVMNY